MSDTPRTDEREHEWDEPPINNWVESAFARTLERELSAMTVERDKLDEELTTLNSQYDSAMVRVAKLAAERDALRSELEGHKENMQAIKAVHELNHKLMNDLCSARAAIEAARAAEPTAAPKHQLTRD